LNFELSKNNNNWQRLLMVM